MSWPTPVWSIVANGGRPQGLLLHDFEFSIAGQEAAGVVARHAERGLREVVRAEADLVMRDGGVRDLVGKGRKPAR